MVTKYEKLLKIYTVDKKHHDDDDDDDVKNKLN